MRLLRTAAVAATTVLGAGAAAVAAGRYSAAAALKPAAPPLPAGFGGPPLTVHAGGAPDEVLLTRTFAAVHPGTYGLAGPGCHAVVGPVLRRVAPVDTVVRRLEWLTYGDLTPGTQVRLTPQVHIGDPGTALGLDYLDVDVPGDLGPLPAWFIPGTRDTWVITVHGLGTTREHPMVVLRFLYRHHFPVLDLSYRGDPDAPRSPDGLGHLGRGEWPDLDAAIRYCVRYGAQRVVLYGWSSGAAMALLAAARTELRDRVSGLVLDSPVLDWRTTLRSLATAHGVPSALLPLAVRAAAGFPLLHVSGKDALPETLGAGNAVTAEAARTAGPVTTLERAEPAEHVEPAEHAGPAEYARRLAGAAGGWDRPMAPILVVHGPGDTIAPWERSRTFAERHPGQVTLHTVRRAPHAAMWNADPAGYEETLRRFLTPLM